MIAFIYANILTQEIAPLSSGCFTDKGITLILKGWEKNLCDGL